MSDTDEARPERTQDEGVMDSLKETILKLNAVLELAARQDINIELTLSTGTRPELNVPYLQLRLNSAHKQLYKPLIVQPR